MSTGGDQPPVSREATQPGPPNVWSSIRRMRSVICSNSLSGSHLSGASRERRSGTSCDIPSLLSLAPQAPTPIGLEHAGHPVESAAKCGSFRDGLRQHSRSSRQRYKARQRDRFASDRARRGGRDTCGRSAPPLRRPLGRAPTQPAETQQTPRRLRSSVEAYGCRKGERHEREQRGDPDGVRPAGVRDRGEAKTDQQAGESDADEQSAAEAGGHAGGRRRGRVEGFRAIELGGEDESEQNCESGKDDRAARHNGDDERDERVPARSGLRDREAADQRRRLGETPARDDRSDGERGAVAGGFVASAPDEGNRSETGGDRDDKRRQTASFDETLEQPMRL